MGATCDTCQDITKEIEREVLRNTMGAFRLRMNFPTGQKHQRPEKIDIVAIKNEIPYTIKIPISDYPAIFPIILLPRPGSLVSSQPRSYPLNYQIILAQTIGVSPESLGYDRFEAKWNVNAVSFSRFVAKIAHCFAVRQLGINGFTHSVTPLIIIEDISILDFVGTTEELNPPAETPPRIAKHSLRLEILPDYDNTLWVAVYIRFFANWKGHIQSNPELGMPEYVCLVGRPNESTFPQILNQQKPFYKPWTKRDRKDSRRAPKVG